MRAEATVERPLTAEKSGGGAVGPASSPATASIKADRVEPQRGPGPVGQAASCLEHSGATADPSGAPPQTVSGCPFVRLPHDVAMDPRLPADALAVLAYRGSFVGEFRLDHRAIRKQLGIGKSRFYAILKLLRELGYLAREQTRRGGGFGRAHEKVSLEAAPHRRPGYRVHYRSQFEQASPAKSLGAYLYLASFVRSFAISLSQVQARFQWSNGTARTHLSALVEAALVHRQQTRNASGRFKRTAYVARWPNKPDGVEPHAAKPGAVVRDTAKPDTAVRGTPKPDAYLSSKSTNNQSGRGVNEYVVARERDDLPRADQTEEAARELMSCDRAGALAPHLLSPRGLAPYLEMLREHGELARQVVVDLLGRALLDGSRPGKIRSWKYFAPALADAVEAAERALNCFDRAELQSSWRSKPLDPPF